MINLKEDFKNKFIETENEKNIFTIWTTDNIEYNPDIICCFKSHAKLNPDKILESTNISFALNFFGIQEQSGIIFAVTLFFICSLILGPYVRIPRDFLRRSNPFSPTPQTICWYQRAY